MSSSEEAFSIFRRWRISPTALTLIILSEDRPPRPLSMHRVNVSSIDERGRRVTMTGIGEIFERIVEIDGSSFTISDDGETVKVSTAVERFTVSTRLSIGEL